MELFQFEKIKLQHLSSFFQTGHVHETRELKARDLKHKVFYFIHEKSSSLKKKKKKDTNLLSSSLASCLEGTSSGWTPPTIPEGGWQIRAATAFTWFSHWDAWCWCFFSSSLRHEALLKSVIASGGLDGRNVVTKSKYFQPLSRQGDRWLKIRDSERSIFQWQRTNVIFGGVR